jgi:diacylglycerol kinase (ATP)
MIKLIRSLVAALGYALQGLVAASRERAFRLELALSMVLLPLACYLGETGLERAVLILSWLIVLMAELLNSAIETAIDRISVERHPLSKKAKDVAAAGVLLALVTMTIVWILIIFPHLKSYS